MRDFTPANELRYLSIVDEALSNGHLFAFFNHGEPYADKPPLYFWLVMLLRLIFGRHCVFALSLLSFIPAAVTTIVMDRWAFGFRREASAAERSAVALMLCSTFYWFGLSFFMRMDMLMVMFIVLALYSWHRDRPWLYALFTFLGLFTKGLVGILMPVLTVLVYAFTTRKAAQDTAQRHVGRFLGWRFLLLAGGCCAIWFTFAWLEGGTSYLNNLLFHQTVDRAVNAYHHKQPFWYYLLYIWPVLLPWAFLTFPAGICSLLQRGESAAPATEDQRSEKVFRCAFFTAFVMLSCSSGKLPVYLLPLIPFVTYLLPLYVRRHGWQRWMDWVIALSGILTALFGLAVASLPFVYEKIQSLAGYSFLSSFWFSLAGLALFCGGVATAVIAFRPEFRILSVRPLALSIMLGFLLVATQLKPANDFIGYGNLCKEIPAGEKVYVRDLLRPLNMDVYLGREVFELSDDELVPEDGAFVSKASFSAPELEGRERRVVGKRAVWLPAEVNR